MTAQGLAVQSAPFSATHPWLLLLLADSALPTGGFVASSGLEASVHMEIVPQGDEAALEQFVRSSVHSYAHASVGFVEEAWRIVNDGLKADLNARTNDETETDHNVRMEDSVVLRLIALDRLLEACTTTAPARRASSAQGGAALMLYSKSFSGLGDGTAAENQAAERKSAVVDAFKVAVRRDESPGHLAVCFGAVARCLDLQLAPALHLHLFLHARSLLSAAVRLNLVGPYSCQRLLASLESSTVASLDSALLFARSKSVWEGTVGTTCPALEVAQGAHDRLYSRLFNS